MSTSRPSSSEPFSFQVADLVRWLPHRSARGLGRAWGRVTFTARRRRRQRAAEHLHLAFPELDGDRRAAIAREASASSAATTADLASASRFDAVELCRRLTLAGWSHLDEAQRAGHGALLLTPRLGLWQLAAIVVALYRGPMAAIGPTFDDPILRRWLDKLEAQHGHRILASVPTPSSEEISQRFASGGLVACSIDSATGVQDGEGVTVPFLGRPLCLSSAALQAAQHIGAPVVPIFGQPAMRGTYRVEIGEPIVPDEGGVQHLIQRSLEAVEQAIQRRPELWPWPWSREDSRSTAGG